MAIILTRAEPLVDEGPAVEAADDQLVVRAEDSQRDGCPVLSKTRVLIVDKGQEAVIEWQMRDRLGNSVEVASLILPDEGDVADSSSSVPDGQVIFRFMDALGINPTIHQIIGTGYDLTAGIVRCQLSELLVSVPGIYEMTVGITDGDGRLTIVDKGYLSVERGLFGDTQHLVGPPTIQEVRMQLRDTLLENRLLPEVEFPDVELIYAIIRPIQEWNETPPPVALYNASSFPFRHHWLLAITANLLLSAAHWYERNNMPAAHGGVQVNDMAKALPYLQLAGVLREEWKEFIKHKKVSINAGLAAGAVGSPYGWM